MTATQDKNIKKEYDVTYEKHKSIIERHIPIFHNKGKALTILNFDELIPAARHPFLLRMYAFKNIGLLNTIRKFNPSTRYKIEPEIMHFIIEAITLPSFDDVESLLTRKVGKDLMSYKICMNYLFIMYDFLYLELINVALEDAEVRDDFKLFIKIYGELGYLPLI
ncbi:MAG: hypothetical protein ACRC92_27130 [Peptostreptococcaceae bacterium]